MNISKMIYGIAVCQLACGVGHTAETPLYQDVKAPQEKRVEDLFGRLTLEEKLTLLGGTGFTTQPIPRLGVPAMKMVDAGQGVREGSATAFPAGVMMGSTWDPDLMRQLGQAIGEEARNKGAQVLLGPAMNIHRSPLGGRNAEYFSEDPFLSTQLAVGYIQGMQSAGVAACAKHFACNNQEADRGSVNVVVSERALREIYLPAFEASVKEGKVWTLMSAYNKVNGPHASAHAYLLAEVLKKQWGFDGVVMSDWGGVHETAVVQAGNDLEMPRGDNMSVPKLKVALANGSVTQAAVDDAIHRIVRTIVRVGLLDGPIVRDAKNVNSPAHNQVALDVAQQGIVLLKNESSLLPLDSLQIKSMAVIGEAADNVQIGALGSPAVSPLKHNLVSFLKGIKARAGSATVTSVGDGLEGDPIPASALQSSDGVTGGLKGEYFKGKLQGEPVFVRQDPAIIMRGPLTVESGLPQELSKGNVSVRWTGRLCAPSKGRYYFTFTADSWCSVFLDGKRIIHHQGNSWSRGGAVMMDVGSAELEAGKLYDLRVEYADGAGKMAQLTWCTPDKTPYGEAIAAARRSDVAIVVVSTKRRDGECQDLSSMYLPNYQSEMIRAVAAANPRTIVVMNNGTPVHMQDWLAKVPAVVETWYPGQAGGTALAAILFGDVNPSGKLPDTFAVSREDYPDSGNFPGNGGKVDYQEGIYVGYRHFDKAGIAPLFPFGHGLSYTTFVFGQPELSAKTIARGESLTVKTKVSNTGRRAGAEVVQLYIAAPQTGVPRPPRELKGFQKVFLQPGESKMVSFAVAPRDLSFWDVPSKGWKAEPGTFEVLLGASSRDIRGRQAFVLADEGQSGSKTK